MIIRRFSHEILPNEHEHFRLINFCETMMELRKSEKCRFKFLNSRFSIHKKLTGCHQLNLQQQQIVLQIRNSVGDTFGEVLVPDLYHTFPNRLITGHGSILWLAISPDLSPNESPFCGVM